MRLWQTVKTQMKCGISSGATLFAKPNKQSSEKEIQMYIFYLEIITCEPSPSQAYCIKPEG